MIEEQPDLTKFDSYDPDNKSLKMRPLTKVQMIVNRSQSTVILALESRADTEPRPHRFETGLTAEQAMKIGQSLLDSADRLA